MKKILYTLLAITIIFSACEKNESNNTNNNSNNSSNNSISVTDQNIIGVWDITSLVYDGVDYTDIVGFEGASFIINSDNTFRRVSLFNGEIEEELGYWDLNGSELTLFGNSGDEVKYNITTFNGTTANLTLVHYLVGDYNYYTSGSATLVKQ